MSVTKKFSIHGLEAFTTQPDGHLAGREGLLTGGAGKPAVYQPGPDTVAIFEDFMDTGSVGWNSLEGDTGNSQAAQAGTNGVWRLTMSGTLTAAPSNVNRLAHFLKWKGDQGWDPKAGFIRIGARVKIGTVSRNSPDRVSVFIGFTDTGATNVPIYDTGGGLVAQASNAVGVMFGSRADTGWSGVAVNGDTTRTAVVLDTGVTTNVYDTVEVEVRRGISDTGGSAAFYINGERKGVIASPIIMNRALMPAITIFQEDTGGGNTLDVDWVHVAGTRDTGL